MINDNLALSGLVNLEEWQALQDLLSDALDITLRTIAVDGAVLTNTSRANRVCTEILPRLSGKSEFCNNCLHNMQLSSPMDIRETTNIKCPLFLDLYVVPIKAAGDRIVAYVMVGPIILKNRRSRGEYSACAEKLGISVEKLMDAIIEINVFSYNKVYVINRLIEYIFSFIARTGYHKKRLGEMAPEIMGMDPLFLRYYEEKVLNALLNACTLAFDADSGSVMTLDRKTNTLHVKVSSKLDQDAGSSEIKLSDSIAGFAVSTAQPIILPKDENKSGLSEKLKRKYIKSSMIIPFTKGDEHDASGVINLNIMRRNRDFSDKDIALVKELANIASIALTPLQPKENSKK